MMLVELKQGLLKWSPYGDPLLLSPPAAHKPNSFKIYATVESMNESIERHHQSLTAKERRQLRNSRRESKAATYNWREEVEERLIKKSKKKRGSWTEELNLDKLACLGPQWWVVRVSRMAGSDTHERLARLLAQKFPSLDFKVYVPSVQIKKKLKNGTISEKPRPLFPGCVFLRCILDKDVHDFLRECDGVGGFVGAKVGNTKRQINKPRPVDAEDMEAIYKGVKHEQDEADLAFLEEHQGHESLDFEKLNLDPNSANSTLPNVESNTSVKARGRQRKAAKPSIGDQLRGNNAEFPIPGSTVQVVAGAFAGFSGVVKKFDGNTGLVTVGLTLFGKETLADLGVNEITVETTCTVR